MNHNHCFAKELEGKPPQILRVYFNNKILFLLIHAASEGSDIAGGVCNNRYLLNPQLITKEGIYGLYKFTF